MANEHLEYNILAQQIGELSVLRAQLTAQSIRLRGESQAKDEQIKTLEARVKELEGLLASGPQQAELAKPNGQAGSGVVASQTSGLPDQTPDTRA